jgi:hypothetical protein
VWHQDIFNLRLKETATSSSSSTKFRRFGFFVVVDPSDSDPDDEDDERSCRCDFGIFLLSELKSINPKIYKNLKKNLKWIKKYTKDFIFKKLSYNRLVTQHVIKHRARKKRYPMIEKADRRRTQLKVCLLFAKEKNRLELLLFFIYI